MADGETQSSGGSRMGVPFNPVKRFVRRLGGKTRYRGGDASKFPNFTELDREIDFRGLANLHQEIKQNFKRFNELAQLHQDLLTYYQQLGPYTSEKPFETEKDAIENGMGEMDQKRFEIKRGSAKLETSYHLPRPKSISYPDGRSYEVAFFGVSNSAYWEELKKDVSRICAKAMKLVGNKEDQEKARNNLSIFEKAVTEIIDKAAQEISNEVENPHLQRLQSEISPAWENINRELSKNVVKTYALTSNQVRYTHCYKIIKPNLSDAEKRELQQEGFDRWDWEQDLGLDEHGWPLEIADGNLQFGNKTVKKGSVLIDIYDRDSGARNPPKTRVIPQDLYDRVVIDCDPMDTVNWIYASYDAYLNDLRDGRYHSGSVTAFDRILRELPVPDLATPRKGSPLDQQSVVNLKLNGGGNLQIPLRPTQFDPAFDIRGRGKLPRHKGRRYYYDVQENSEMSDEPMISSRGAALYIIHNALEYVKYWSGNGEQGQQGIMEFLNAVSHITGGLDIGPNLEQIKGGGMSGNPFESFGA